METDMRAAVDFLYDLPKFTTKNSLDHTRKLMGLLGDPCLDRKVIHVAGSNGKGSVCCYLYHMLLAAGKSAGMFTSPHLVDIRERFQMDGGMVGEEDFLIAFHLVKNASNELVRNNLNHPTFFEFIFAMAMVLFEKAQTEYIILETGLGGRLDATNSYPYPILSVITSISLEHTEILGSTLALIAAEKAGILKAGVPAVFLDGEPETAEVIRARAEHLGCAYCAVSRAEQPGGACCAASRAEQPENAYCEREKLFYIYEIKEKGIDFSFLTAYDRTHDEDEPRSTRRFAESAHGTLRQTEHISQQCVARQPAAGTPRQEDCKLRRCGIRQPAAGTLRQAGCKQQCVTRQPADHVWHIPGQALWQAENAALAVAAMHMLHLMPDAVIQRGLTAASWPGRMQEVRPEVWCDGAHNPSGIAAFAQTVRRLAGADPFPPLLIFSMVREKDIRTAVRLLTEDISWEAIAVAAVPGERGIPAGVLAQLFREADAFPPAGTAGAAAPAENTAGAAAPGISVSAEFAAPRTSCPVETFDTPGAALSAIRVRKKPGQKLFCTGSLYFIGELLKGI
ncbi:MAG: hypothetical protein LIO75_03550 [Lachnospiraceae bacterium]|nr:hypothetical protein [Lachnospiraceae bacterium]